MVDYYDKYYVNTRVEDAITQLDVITTLVNTNPLKDDLSFNFLRYRFALFLQLSLMKIAAADQKITREEALFLENIGKQFGVDLLDLEKSAGNNKLPSSWEDVAELGSNFFVKYSGYIEKVYEDIFDDLFFYFTEFQMKFAGTTKIASKQLDDLEYCLNHLFAPTICDIFNCMLHIQGCFANLNGINEQEIEMSKLINGINVTSPLLLRMLKSECIVVIK